MNELLIRKIDTQTGCYFDDLITVCEDLATVESLLDVGALKCGDVIELDSTEYACLVDLLSLPVNRQAEMGELRVYRLGDGPNLKSHTGRELRLMLQGLKPFSAFSEIVPDDQGLFLIPEDKFCPFCLAGQILKHEYTLPFVIAGQQKELRRVLYALPGQEWRFWAHQMLWLLANKYGWDPTFEKFEGYLLGYETELDEFFRTQKAQEQ